LRIISRSHSNIHEAILETIGIPDVVHPEQDAAFRLTKIISFNYALDYCHMDNKHSIAEVVSLMIFNGRPIKELDLTKKYAVSLVTIICELEKISITKDEKKEVKGLVTGETILQNSDILVCFLELIKLS